MSFDERKRSFVEPSVACSSGDDETVPVVKRAKKGEFRVKSLCADKGFGRMNDEIHSSINFCPVMKVMMDTKQMQRLRGLKQLGTVEYVYVNADHNRFEHSLGVAHLAERLCQRLKARQPELGISEKDVLCVKLAGLLHDLGHGPFSHVYDGRFRQQLASHLEANPELREFYDGLPEVDENWMHEDASLMMIDAALADLGLQIDMANLNDPLKQVGDGLDALSMRVYHQWVHENSNDVEMENTLTSRDWVFIKECIIGRPIHDKVMMEGDKSGFVGRSLCSQEFLYDIVANRHTGLDVDKIDYYARDQRRTNRDAGEIELRMIEEAVVAWGRCSKPHKCFRCKRYEPQRHLMICYPEKMAINAMAFFSKRFELHSKIYNHKTSLAATLLVCDILKLADPHFKLPTYLDEDGDGEINDKKPKFLPISRAMLDKVAYFRLRDCVIDQIFSTTTPELREARKLILRLNNRDFYKCSGIMKVDMTNEVERAIFNKPEHELEDDILRLNGQHEGMAGRIVTLEKDDVIVLKNKLHHGAGDDNPLSLLRFLPKRDLSSLSKSVEDLPEAKEEDVNKHKSHVKMAWKEYTISFYCRGSEEKKKLLEHVFELFKSEVESEKHSSQTSVTDEQVNGCYDLPVKLTQDSETNTPMKSSDYMDSDVYEDESPIINYQPSSGTREEQEQSPVVKRSLIFTRNIFSSQED